MTTTPLSSPAPEPEFGYGQLFGVLLRRWPWLLGALALSTAAAVFVSLREEPTYRSSMQLLVEPNYEDDLTEQDFSGVVDDGASDVDYTTQLTLMRSEQFLQAALESLGDSYPELTVGDLRGGYTLLRVVEDRSKTRIFQAEYIGEDPSLTQDVLDALKTAYLAYNEEQQARRLSRGLDNINDRLDNTRQNLRSAQTALEQFRQGQNLIDPAQQAAAVVAALDRVQTEQQQLMVELEALETRYQTLEQRTALSPDNALLAARLSQSNRVQTLLNNLQESNLALADRRVLFTDEDATVQVLEAQRNNELGQLRQEISAVIRRPVEDLDPELLSYLQLGGIDLNLVGELIEADANLSSISARWESLIALEDSLRSDLNRYPSLMAEYDRLQPRVEIERTTLQDLLLQREQISAELERGGFTWQVIEPPQLGNQIGPDPVKPLALGIVAGLFVGGALAFARESMDQVVRSSDVLKRQVPLPLLGMLPAQTGRRGFNLPGRQEEGPMLHPELADSDVMQLVQGPAFRESLDLVANTLQLMLRGQEQGAVAITSALAGEGKTTMTLGLAFSLARMSQRVLVIDADLRRSGVQRELGLATQSNLAQLLQGGTQPQTPHRVDLGITHIDILPAGQPPEDPITLLSSPRFQRLIQRCKEIYDVVLVDTPPVLGMADALKVGAACDSLVLVTRLDRINQNQLNEALSLLAPLRVLGLVANGARSTSTRYADYGPPPERVSQVAS